MQNMKLKVGQKPPDFKLPDQDGKTHALADGKGRWTLLYFYPRDNTSGCTREAEALRDAFTKYKKLKVAVYGISADTVQSHKKFAEKLELPFALLADPDKKVLKAYGAWGKKKFMGREYMGIHRMSVLIDKECNVAKIYEKVKPADHAEEVLADIKEMQK